MSATTVKQAPVNAPTASRVTHIPRRPYAEPGTPAVVGLCGYRPTSTVTNYAAAAGELPGCVVCADLWDAGDR